MTPFLARSVARPRTLALAPLGVYLVAVVVLLGPSLVGARVALPHDLHLQHLPWRVTEDADPPRNRELLDHVDTYYPVQHELLGRLRSGTDATWIRDVGFGQLGIEFVGWGALSPFNLPALVLPFDLAWSWAQALRLLAAMLGAHVLVRSLGAGRAGATVAGLSYGLSGFVIGWLGWPQSHVAAFVPWVLWAVRATTAARPRPEGPAALALAVAGLWLGGFPAVATYALLAAGIVGLHGLAALRPLGWGAVLWRGLVLLGGVAAGTLLVAFTLAPSLGWLEVMDLSARASALDSRVPPAFLWTLLFPGIFGDGVDQPRWVASAFVETIGYAGVVTAALAVAAHVLRPRRAGVWLFSGLGIGAGLLAYGFPPLVALVGQLPGLDINPPARALFLVCLCIAVVGGLGADALLGWVAGRGRADRRALAVVVAGAGVVAAVVVASGVWSDLRELAVSRLEGPQLRAAARGAATSVLAAAGFLLAAGGVVGAARRLARASSGREVRSGASRPERARLLAGIGLVAVVAVDLLVFAAGWNVQVPRRGLFPGGPGIAALQADSVRHRTAGADGAGYANANLEYDIADLRLRGFLTERQRAVLVAAGARFTSPTRWDLDVSRAGEWEPWLSAAAVRTVLAPAGDEPPPTGWSVEERGPVRLLGNPSTRQRVHAAPRGVRVAPGAAADRLAAAGPAALDRTALVEADADVPLPAGADARVRWWESTGARTRAVVDSDGGAVVVLADAAVPGWTAAVDGAPAPVVTADHLFVGVVVPAGEHTVELRYRPPYAGVGRALSLVGLALLGALGWWGRRRRGAAPYGAAPSWRQNRTRLPVSSTTSSSQTS